MSIRLKECKILKEAVNDLYPPWRGEDVLVKVARVVDLKSKIHQLDPSWKLLDSDNGCVAKILMYLETQTYIGILYSDIAI